MKLFKRKERRARVIQLCPKCRQPTLKNAFNVSGWLANPMFECTNTNCNYIGLLFLEYDLDEIVDNTKISDNHQNNDVR